MQKTAVVVVTSILGLAGCSTTRPRDPSIARESGAYQGDGLAVPAAPAATPWKVRATGAYGYAGGSDAPNSQGKFGLDVGRDIADGIGVDLYWRTQNAEFDRAPNGSDCGVLQSIGAKVTFEWPLGSGPFYFWSGVGAGSTWSGGYIDDDTGFGVLGEGGLGYELTHNTRLRLGADIQGFDIATGRNDPARDGSSRWLWIVAPALEFEFRF